MSVKNRKETIPESVSQEAATAAGVGAGVSGRLLGAFIGASLSTKPCSVCRAQIPSGNDSCPACGSKC